MGARVVELLDSYRNGGIPTDSEIEQLRASGMLPVQRGAFDAVIAAKRPEYSSVHVSSDSPFGKVQSPVWREILGRVHAGKALGPELVSSAVTEIKLDLVDEETIGRLLMDICLFGLQDDDTGNLTDSMARSGSTYDYRTLDDLRGRTSLRRYPSGALSEKVALLMPSIISVMTDEVPIYSPFLVARSLSFTGGTWDKLSAIKGFAFPKPGNETARCLVECGVAMTVTSDDLNPVDRKLYQLRSLSGTVANRALIVSSIASKQIAVPVDYALLDIRFGDGAFIDTACDAKRIAVEIRGVMETHGIRTLYALTDTSEPTGSAVGNALEVCEAIEILQCGNSGLFDARGLLQQGALTVDFMGKLLARAFPSTTAGQWSSHCWDLLRKGKCWAGFKRILRAHSVSESEISRLESSSTYLIDGRQKCLVASDWTGQVTAIDQKKLGRIVNFELGGGANEYGYERDLYSGAILGVRVGDYVGRGTTLATLIGDKVSGEVVNEVRGAFAIG